MKIFKKQLKNILSNKIFKNNLTLYNLFFIIIDSTQNLPFITKKNVTKFLFLINYNSLKTYSFIYPIKYVQAKDCTSLINTYLQLQKHNDFKKIIISNIKINFYLFKSFNNIIKISLQNSINLYIKFYCLLKTLIYIFSFQKLIK